MSTKKVLIYLLRRDLRLADNPIFHEIALVWSAPRPPFTAVLPVYIFPAEQIEISGFITDPNTRCPYPEARSQVGNFWRCGRHRAKFIAESVWDLKKDLQATGSGLAVRVGLVQDVVRTLLEGFKDDEVAGLWMTKEEGVEEARQERAARREVESRGKEFRLWKDEKYFVDDDDLPFERPRDLPDVFTTFRKQVEPLRDVPRAVLPRPSKLPPLPESIPAQAAPFSITEDLQGLISALQKPLAESLELQNPPKQPSSPSATSAFPFAGGSTTGHARIQHLLKSGAMTNYKSTRNGLLGTDFSSKLSAWLTLGSVTARQVHAAMRDFENGTDAQYKGSEGYGKGENAGTAAMRFELLWRDYFRLCVRKFGPRLFRAGGFRGEESLRWGYDEAALKRWLEGTTGMGLVDAAQRELFLTGYTSNRTRQNVASFLAKHLRLDWRLGAEWYECCLVDYDLGSNWGNWQYNSGVGNDPREGGIGRKFNPVKQAFDYDKNADYVKSWVEEVKDVSAPKDAFQYESRAGSPLVRIEYDRGRGGDRGGGAGRGKTKGRGRGRGRDAGGKHDRQ